jgi:hypothetical protein
MAKTTPYAQLPPGARASDFHRVAGPTQHYRNAAGVEITRRDYDKLREGRRVTSGMVPPFRGDTEAKYYRVVARLEQGESLVRAAKAEHIDPETVRNINKQRELFQPLYHYKKQPSGATRPTTVRGYRVEARASTPIVHPDGTYITGPSVDTYYASLLGAYWNAVDEALKGDTTRLRTFADVTIYTTDGQAHRLMTDVNALYRLYEGMSAAESYDWERNFYSKAVIYAAA